MVSTFLTRRQVLEREDHNQEEVRSASDSTHGSGHVNTSIHQLFVNYQHFCDNKLVLILSDS